MRAKLAETTNAPGGKDRDPSLALRRQLRRQSTDAERRLWRLLRSQQIGAAKFRRQHQLSPYILDFYCMEHKLAIEVDGGQHFTAIGIEADAERTRFLANRGIRCLRFTDREVLREPDSVIAAISQALGSPSP